MKQLEVTLSRAHKIAERLKDLMKESLTDLESAATPTSFSSRPAPSLVASLATQAETIFKKADAATEYAKAWATVRGAIAAENHKLGIDAKLTELESLNKLTAAYKLLVAHSKEEGYLPSEIGGYTPEGSTYGFSLTVNPLREPATTAKVAADLLELQRRSIQLSDKIAESNANRVTLELPAAIVTEVTGGVPLK